MGSQTKKKKGKKFKIHYDRLFAQLLLIVLLIFLFVSLISVCTSDDSINDGREIERDAVSAGRRDAEKVLDTAPGSMERDGALLFIRAREHELRKNGHGHAADDYIDAARKYLQENGIE